MAEDSTVSKIKAYIDRVTDSQALERTPTVSTTEGFQDRRVSLAHSGLRKLQSNAQPSMEELISIEAIILPNDRPAIDIIDGSYQRPPAPWSHFDEPKIKNQLTNAIPSIGRINVPDLPIPFAGTGFVVGHDLLMTNRHVASVFANGLGQRKLGLTSPANLNFKHELHDTGQTYLKVTELIMIHPYWDMALLRVAGLPAGHPALTLSAEPIDSFIDTDIAVIGYPAYDDRNDPNMMDRIFRGYYDIKRLQPGKIWQRQQRMSYKRLVDAITHDSSTLGGNSGSAIVSTDNGQVLALHFSGTPLQANYAVATCDLAQDARVVDAGVNFSASTPPTDKWDFAWNDAERINNRKIYTPPRTTAIDDHKLVDNPQQSINASTINTLTDGNSVTFTIPLTITVSLGTNKQLNISQATTSADHSEVETLGTEATSSSLGPIKPDQDYSNRKGYIPNFLDPQFEVAVPWLTSDQYADVAFNRNANRDRHLLHYEHFSICMKRSRSQAYFTATMIDGALRKNVGSPSSRWFEEKRITTEEQYMNDVYAGNPLDRGHLTRRLSPVWGDTLAEAKKSHDDTFHWTNSAPQHEGLNRGSKTWRAVENHILNHAENSRKKLIVFTGPVFREDDPIVNLNSGNGPLVQIPLDFWKVVAFIDNNNQLKATAFLLSQRDLIMGWLESLELPTSDKVDQFQVSLTEIESMTGLSFLSLTQHDTFGINESISTRQLITSLEDVKL